MEPTGAAGSGGFGPSDMSCQTPAARLPQNCTSAHTGTRSNDRPRLVKMIKKERAYWIMISPHSISALDPASLGDEDCVCPAWLAFAGPTRRQDFFPATTIPRNVHHRFKAPTLSATAFSFKPAAFPLASLLLVDRPLHPPPRTTMPCCFGTDSVARSSLKKSHFLLASSAAAGGGRREEEQSSSRRRRRLHFAPPRGGPPAATHPTARPYRCFGTLAFHATD